MKKIDDLALELANEVYNGKVQYRFKTSFNYTNKFIFTDLYDDSYIYASMNNLIDKKETIYNVYGFVYEIEDSEHEFHRDNHDYIESELYIVLFVLKDRFLLIRDLDKVRGIDRIVHKVIPFNSEEEKNEILFSKEIIKHHL